MHTHTQKDSSFQTHRQRNKQSSGGKRKEMYKEAVGNKGSSGRNQERDHTCMPAARMLPGGLN
jgi:hypothetical protein